MKNKRTKYYIQYTIIFLFLFFACFGFYLLVMKKTALRPADTFDQHYMEFIYLGRWVRSLITEGRFVVWDPSIGYGADFFLTMSGFICDPVNWIAIFFSARAAEYGFLLMVIIKLYLCGISYSVFAHHRRHKPYTVLCGAVLFTFCACAYTGMYQSGFITPMYILPILLYGVDELFERKKSGIYVRSLAFCAIGNFYTTYMLSILVICYCIVKWFTADGFEKNWKNLVVTMGRFLLYSVWSAAIAAVILLPVGILMLGMGRLDLTRYVPTFYDAGFYSNMFKGFIAGFDMQGRDCKIGFSVLILIAVFVLFLTKGKEYRRQKIEFILMAVGLCIPFVGHVMNGFGYVANRWVWAFALLLAYIATMMIPIIKEMKVRKRFFVTLLALLYVFIGYKAFDASGTPFLVLSIILIGLCLISFLFRRIPNVWYQRLMICFSCLTVIVPAYFSYMPKYGNAFGNYIAAGTAYSSATEDGGLPLLKQIDALSDGTRYNRFYGLHIVRNASWIYGVSGTDFYMNLYNDGIDQFHNDMAMNTSPWSFGYNGIDRRSELLALLGVNHYFMTSGYRYFPVGIDTLEAEDDVWGNHIESWTSKYNGSLFTRFSEAVAYEEYKKLSPIERQQVLMKACVLDGENGIPTDQIEIDRCTVDYQMESLDGGIQFSEHDFYVNYGGAQLVLSFEPQDNAELYVYFDQLEFDNGLAMGYTISVNGMSGEEAPPSMWNTFSGLNYIHHMYGGKKDWMLNLGIVPEKADRIVVTFQDAGHYSLNGIYVFAEKTDQINENIINLNRDVKGLAICDNAIDLTIDNEDSEYLFAAIPYSSGWHAYDNGKEIRVMRADAGFMALDLSAGHHEITFFYRTPGIIVGLVISLVSIVGYILIQIRSNSGKNTRLNQGEEEL